MTTVERERETVLSAKEVAFLESCVRAADSTRDLAMSKLDEARRVMRQVVELCNPGILTGAIPDRPSVWFEARRVIGDTWGAHLPRPPSWEEKCQAAGLTPSESRVLGLVARGMTSREVGAALCLNHATVKNYLHRIFPKLGVHTRTAAVAAIHDGQRR